MRQADSALGQLVDVLRAHPGLRGKAAIGLVSDVLGASDWLAGPGDDGAVVDAFGGHVVACGEALWPPSYGRTPTAPASRRY